MKLETIPLRVFDLVQPQGASLPACATFDAGSIAEVLMERGFLVDRVAGRLFASVERGGALLQVVAHPAAVGWRVCFAVYGRVLTDEIADVTALHHSLDHRVPRHLHIYAGGDT